MITSLFLLGHIFTTPLPAPLGAFALLFIMIAVELAFNNASVLSVVK